MIKSSMELLDILFPINLGPLTYNCPEEFVGIVKPGMAVTALLKNRSLKGIVIEKSSRSPSGEIKDIQKVHGDTPFLSDRMINLLRWMSEYYLAEPGIVLKNFLPKEAFTKVKRRQGKIAPFLKGGRVGCSFNIINIVDGAISGLMDSISRKIYKTYLLQAPSSMYEYSFVLKIISGIRGAIILLPEVSQINEVYPLFSNSFGERLCLLHGALSRGERSEAFEKILSGDADIVLGTRSAVFAPLRKVSLIAVLQEQSNSYKQKDSPYYNGRDVAVMRGYLERATVLLSSTAPSIESYFNCRSGKYTLLKPEDSIKRPRVRIVDMRFEKLLRPYISKPVVDASRRYMKRDKRVMFIINRRGYSTLLQCGDCNYIEECPDCRIPLVFHKQDMSLKCHYCGYVLTEIPESCRRCRGYNIKLLGAGTQRLQEDTEEIMGTKTLRFDSDRIRKRSEIFTGTFNRDDIRIIIGTKLLTRRFCGPEGFSMAAVMNADLFLNLPDFRSAEKAYQEISSVIDKIEADGEIFIQTRMPENYLFRYLKNHNYESFFLEEINRRKSLFYPPYSRLVLIKFMGKENLSAKLLDIIKKTDRDVEILGPSLSKRKGKNEVRLLLKSSVRGKLHSAARSFKEAFRDSKDVVVRVDVDCLSLE
ncbi:MAG: primosomal protein N' [Nitrospirota bacterium]